MCCYLLIFCCCCFFVSRLVGCCCCWVYYLLDSLTLFVSLLVDSIVIEFHSAFCWHSTNENNDTKVYKYIYINVQKEWYVYLFIALRQKKNTALDLWVLWFVWSMKYEPKYIYSIRFSVILFVCFYFTLHRLTLFISSCLWVCRDKVNDKNDTFPFCRAINMAFVCTFKSNAQ